MIENILIVDSDLQNLESCKNKLKKTYNIFSASDDDVAIELLDEEGPFAVVASELHIGGKNNHKFLDDVKTFSPDSVNIILTTPAEIPSAVKAVNENNLFRFITKPCSPNIIAEAIAAGVEQYRLVMSERELLEKTLHGSIKILCEMLSLVNPQAFSRAMRLKQYVKHIADQIELTDLWQIEVAAMLSQIGCVTLPPDIVNKVHAREELTTPEKAIYNSHPSVGSKLLANVPRMEVIAGIISKQLQSYSEYPPLTDMAEEERTIALGAQILKVALYFEQLGTREVLREMILEELCKKEGEFNPKILTACANFKFQEAETTVKMITIKGLDVGMVTDEDIVSKSGLLLMPKGLEITYTSMERLRNISHDGVGIKEPFRVRVFFNS